jgi:hydroxymethylpyrimidine pyrophosphatase-like HAD family hydrolase
MVRTDYSYLFTKIDKEDLLQDRGCQISFSFVGHNADLASKKAFDPDGARRTKYLHSVPFEDKEITVNVGGTTCLDYISKEGTKGKNIERLLKLKKWKPEDCVYVGDALFKGRNDETVIGVIPNLVRVDSPIDTLKFIEEQLND